MTRHGTHDSFERKPDARLGGGGWPPSPLAAVGRAFDLLVAAPTVYVVDGGDYPGLPDEPIAADRLQALLLSRRASPSLRDAVWRELVTRARQPGPDGQGWTVIAAGMALPGLTAAVAGLTRGWRGETADLDAEVLAGFVARLKTLDLAGGRVVGRLIDAGLRAGRHARAQVEDATVVRVERAWSSPPAQPWGHPDWVLARAVAVGVLDRTEARLIGATRLEDYSLAQAATALDVDPSLAADWRWRAETRLAAAIRSGELGDVALDAPSRGMSTAERLREQRLRAACARRQRQRREPNAPARSMTPTAS